MMMHWRPRRGRREPKPGSKDFAEQAVNEYATKLMYNRWKLLCPFDVKLDDIYHALFTPEQHKAIDHLLRTAPSVFDMRREVKIVFDTKCRVKVQDDRVTASALLITFPRQMVLFEEGRGNPVLLSQLPACLHDPIVEWGHRWITAAQETRNVLGKLTRLFQISNTMGHVKRVWPNAANLLPESALNKLAQAKVRSPYPEAALDCIGYKDNGDGIKQLREEWKPATLEWYDTRLTEALCLPMEDGSQSFTVRLDYSIG